MQRNHELQSTQISIIISTSMPADHPSCTLFPLPQPQNSTSNLLAKTHMVKHLFHKCNLLIIMQSVSNTSAKVELANSVSTLSADYHLNPLRT